MTTTRLDRVIANQRRLMFGSVASMLAFVGLACASVLSFV